MSTIYLVRHCEYDLSHGGLPGRLPVELSDFGREQAVRLHEYFKDKQISHIYSSLVRRCQQASEAISGGTIAIIYEERILETLSAYQGYWYTGDKDRDYFYGLRKYLGGETYEQVYSRTASFWNEILLKQGNYIICSHGDPLFLMYLYSIGEPCPSDLTMEELLTHYEYQLKGSIRKGELVDGCVRWNSVQQF